MNHWWHPEEKKTEQWLLLQRAIGNVCESQTVSYWVGWAPCLLLRKKRSSAATEKPRLLSQCPLPPPTPASPRLGACPLWCPSFFATSKVMMDALCGPPLCISASLCHSWLYEAVSSEPRQVVHIPAQWVCESLRLASVWLGWSQNRSTHMLLCLWCKCLFFWWMNM